MPLSREGQPPQRLRLHDRSLRQLHLLQPAAIASSTLHSKGEISRLNRGAARESKLMTADSSFLSE